MTLSHHDGKDLLIKIFLMPAVLPLPRCGQSHETCVSSPGAGDALGCTEITLPIKYPMHLLTQLYAWNRGGTGLCSLVWSQRKFSGIWKGKTCKQRAIPGAARALGHAEEVCCTHHTQSDQQHAMLQEENSEKILAFLPGMLLTRCLKRCCAGSEK